MSHFDQELALSVLLPEKEVERLCSSLGLLLDTPIAIQDLRGDILGGARGLSAESRSDLVLELEPVGYLLAPGLSSVARAAAANLIRQLLIARARYQMAARVHSAATQADYDELQRQNTALKESQAKYKALSEALESKVAEQVKLIDERQRQLYQAERLASVGQLAAGVAHEINNPIGFVRSNLTTAQKYQKKMADLAPLVKALPGGAAAWAGVDMDFTMEDLADLLNDCIGGVDRVARIVSDLKGFSSVDKPEEEIVHIDEVIAGVLNVAEKKLPSGVRLIRDLHAEKMLLCLPGHLSQALLGVVDNAGLAVAEKGPAGEVRVSSSYDGNQTRIEIRDNGKGIDEATLSRVFDPFFTTRPVGQGTGLGLTVARDIVRIHGGDIEIDSLLGEGTTVVLTLPD